MAGWFAIVGDRREDRAGRIERFRRVFSVSDVPDLVVSNLHDERDIAVYSWSWGQAGARDIAVRYMKGTLFVLAGYLLNHPLLPDGTMDIGPVMSIWESKPESVAASLNGSFSLLVHDSRNKETTVHGDRFCSRAVCYQEDNGAFLIGNFPAALVALKSREPRIDPAGLWSFVNYGRRVGSRSLFEGVTHLLAGESIRKQGDRGVVKETWWVRRYRPERGVSPREWGERIAEVLRRGADSVLATCRHPVLFLSGGLDSRVALGALGDRVSTVCLCPRPDIETLISKISALAVGADHREMVVPSRWYLDSMPAVSLVSGGDYLPAHAHFVRPAIEILREHGDAEFIVGDLLENLNKHYTGKIPAPGISLREIFRWHVPRSTEAESEGWCLSKDCADEAIRLFDQEHDEFLSRILGVSEDLGDRLDTFLRWAGVGLTWTYGMISSLWPIAAERNLYFNNELDDLSLGIPSGIRGSGVLHPRILWRLNPMLALIPNNNSMIPPVLPQWTGKPFRLARPVLGRIGLINPSPWTNVRREILRDPAYRRWLDDGIDFVSEWNPAVFDGQSIRAARAGVLADSAADTLKRARGTRNLAAEVQVVVALGDLLRMVER